MWYLLWFVGIFVDVFALHPCVGMAGPASEKLTNVGLMRRISIASGNQ